MAVNIIEGDTIRMRFANYDPTKSQTALNTMYYQVGTTIGAWTPGQVASAAGAVHGPLFRAWQSPKTQFSYTGVARVKPLPSPESRSTNGAGIGTTGTATLPTQVTGLIGGAAEQYHTGSATVKHPDGVQVLASMRLYISFPTVNLAAEAQDGSMSNSQFDNLLLLATTLLNVRTITASGGKSMVLNPMIRYSTVTLPPVVVRSFFFVPLFQIRVSRLWATQRCRGDRGQQESPQF